MYRKHWLWFKLFRVQVFQPYMCDGEVIQLSFTYPHRSCCLFQCPIFICPISNTCACCSNIWRAHISNVTFSTRTCMCVFGAVMDLGHCSRYCRSINTFLTHWDRDKISAIFQATFSNACLMKVHELRLDFHWFVPKDPNDNKLALVTRPQWVYIGVGKISDISFKPQAVKKSTCAWYVSNYHFSISPFL